MLESARPETAPFGSLVAPADMTEIPPPSSSLASRLLLTAAGLVLCPAGAVAHGQGSEARVVARVIVTSGVDGHLARPVCDGQVAWAEAPFARLTPALASASSALDRPLLLDTGGLLTTGGAARYAVTEAPRALAALVRALGYRALTFGPRELSAPRPPTLAALRALRHLGVPSIATNLRCGRAAAPLCDLLVDGGEPPEIQRVGDLRVAILALLPEDAMRGLPPELVRGLRITPPVAVLERAVPRARALGADLVLVILSRSEVSRGDAAASRGGALSLVARLSDEARPDLVVAADAGDELLFARPPGFRPAVVAAPPGGAVGVRVRESSLIHTYDMLARPLLPAHGVAPAFRRWTARTGRAYCAAWGRELPGGRFHGELGGDDMLELAAGVMRDRTGAEVAVLGRSVLDPRWRPSRPGVLTASDVFVSLEQDRSLVVAEVPASWLESLASRASAHGLLTLGLDAGGTQVNGRPLEARGSYRVVTTRYLAEGGDDALPSGGDYHPVAGTSVRSAVLEHLGTARAGDPRSALGDPAERLQWTLRTDAEASFAGTSVRNPVRPGGDPSYNAAQLSRSDALTFGFAATVNADGSSRRWAFENEALARYRTTRTGVEDFAEGDDLLSLKSTLLYRGLRAASARVYVPEPYLEGYLESEMTRPDTRSYTHLLLRPTLGLRFAFTGKLTLKVGGGFQRELLDAAGRVEPGGVAQLVLTPWELLQQDTRRLTLAFSADYFLTGGAQELRAAAESTLDIAGPFALVFGVKLFAQKDVGSDLGVAVDATIALRVRWLTRGVP